MEGSGSCWTAVDTVDDGVVKGKEMVFIHVKSSQYITASVALLKDLLGFRGKPQKAVEVVPKYLLLHRLPMDGGSPSD